MMFSAWWPSHRHSLSPTAPLCAKKNREKYTIRYANWDPNGGKKWLLRLLQAIIRSKSLTYLAFNAQQAHSHTHTMWEINRRMSPGFVRSIEYIYIYGLPARFKWTFLKLHIAPHCVCAGILCIRCWLTCWRALHFGVFSDRLRAILLCVRWFKSQFAHAWTNSYGKKRRK